MSDRDETHETAVASLRPSERPPTPPDEARVSHPPAPSVWAPPSGYTAIGPMRSERDLRDWALVLQSMGIWHGTVHAVGGWLLLVRDQDYDRARTAIDDYEVENRDWPPPRVRERLRYGRSPWAPITFLALAAFFVITGPASSGARWFTHGKAVADLVLSSEPWRAVTALTLHADSVHVMGNVISGAIFASAVHRRIGPGGGTAAILASGIAGNFANALFHHVRGNGGHASIGASTAVFGAIGILAATQALLDSDGARARASGARRLLDFAGPLVGGLALLGALGASPRADLGAHFFGFLSGVVLGLAAALPMRRGWRPRWWVQSLLAAAAASAVLLSWQLALRR